MERLMQVQGSMPKGVSPILGPVSTGLGEIFQYNFRATWRGGSTADGSRVNKSTNNKRLGGSTFIKKYKRVAEINSQGGYVKQYQVLVNPDRLAHYKIKLSRVFEALEKNNITVEQVFYPKGRNNI